MLTLLDPIVRKYEDEKGETFAPILYAGGAITFIALAFRLGFMAIPLTIAGVGSWVISLMLVLCLFLVSANILSAFGDASSDAREHDGPVLAAWRSLLSTSALTLATLPILEIYIAHWLYQRYGAWEMGREWAGKFVGWLGGELISVSKLMALEECDVFGLMCYSAEGVVSWALPAFGIATLLYVLLVLVMEFSGFNAWAHKEYLEWQAKAPAIKEAHQRKMKQMQVERILSGQAAPAAQEGEQPEIVFRARPARYDFADVVGMEELKTRLKEQVRSFVERGGNGILLTGEPGNGKTFIVEALAGELNWKFLEARADNLTSKWVGETTERINQIFRDARAQAPVILFLDEFDTFMQDRASMGGDGPGADRLNQANAFLTAIADLNKGLAEHQVLVVAATNFRDQLDEAGIREGRFDVKITMPPPDLAARRALIQSELKRKVTFDEASVQAVLKRWEGWSAARIRHLSKMLDEHMRKHDLEVVDGQLLRLMVRKNAEGAGFRLPEGVLSVDQLHFAPALKRALKHIVTMLREPQRLEQVGATLPRGAIFYGPPGTGKTAAAQAIAKDSEWNLLVTTASDLLSTPKKVDDIIKQARDIRPCIVFIDEAEGILRNRLDNPQGKEVTNKLLALIDGPRKLHDVFFIAATNFVEDLDEAMLREGRLSEHLDFTPSEDALLAVVREFVQARPQVRWLGSPEDFVRRYPDLTPANAQGLLNRAIRQQALDSSTGEVTIDLREV